MQKFRIKSGDSVIVIGGSSKGQKGKVTKLDKKSSRIFIEGVNMVKKHMKPSADNPQGGIIEKEASIHISNVSLLDPKTSKPTKIGFKLDSKGKKVRFAKKSGEII